MSKSSSSSSTGVGAPGLLFVALVVLKLIGTIQMSWFWIITSIIWIPLGMILTWLLFIAAIGAFSFVGLLILEKFGK